jgi:hypothetical protein
MSATGGPCPFWSPVSHEDRHATTRSAAICIGIDRKSKRKIAQGGVHHAPAGYDHLALINAGPNPEAFFDFIASEFAEPVRKLAPTS